MCATDNVERIKLQARFFGEFQLSGPKSVLNASGIRSDMVTKLLLYMIYYRKKSSTVQELSEVLWPEDESSNPAGALKNLVYRLRSTLKKEWGEEEFILTGLGCYQWNPKLEVETDVEEFDTCCKLAEKGADSNARIRQAQQAVSLYKGKFLSKYSDEYWIMSLSAFWHNTYLSTVKVLAGDLESENRYDEMEDLCRQAVQLEPLDEKLYCFLLKAFIGNNKQKFALEQFHEIEELLYDNLGVRPSGELQMLYEEMMRQQHDHEQDICVIQKELKNEHKKNGAFLCDYGIFKKTYELELRRAGRLGIPVFLSLISLYPMSGMEKEGSEYLKEINRGMLRMKTVLLNFLRFGDVITRYSVNQYLVMLPGCQYENAKMVLERIKSRFYLLHKRCGLRIHYSINEIE